MLLFDGVKEVKNDVNGTIEITKRKETKENGTIAKNRFQRRHIVEIVPCERDVIYI